MQFNIASKNTQKYSKLSHDLNGATGADLVVLSRCHKKSTWKTNQKKSLFNGFVVPVFEGVWFFSRYPVFTLIFPLSTPPNFNLKKLLPAACPACNSRALAQCKAVATNNHAAMTWLKRKASTNGEVGSCLMWVSAIGVNFWWIYADCGFQLLGFIVSKSGVNLWCM